MIFIILSVILLVKVLSTDIKNIINVPGHGEMERDAAKLLPNDQLLEILSNVPANTLAK